MTLARTRQSEKRTNKKYLNGIAQNNLYAAAVVQTRSMLVNRKAFIFHWFHAIEHRNKSSFSPLCLFLGSVWKLYTQHTNQHHSIVISVPSHARTETIKGKVKTHLRRHLNSKIFDLSLSNISSVPNDSRRVKMKRKKEEPTEHPNRKKIVLKAYGKSGNEKKYQSNNHITIRGAYTQATSHNWCKTR